MSLLLGNLQDEEYCLHSKSPSYWPTMAAEISPLDFELSLKINDDQPQHIKISWGIKNKTNKITNQIRQCQGLSHPRTILAEFLGVQRAVILKTSQILITASVENQWIKTTTWKMAAHSFMLLWVRGKLRSHFYSSQLRLFPAALSSLCIPMISHSLRSPEPDLSDCHLREPSCHRAMGFPGMSLLLKIPFKAKHRKICLLPNASTH